MSPTRILLALWLMLPAGLIGAELTRDGLVFVIPGGDWNTAIGTCTGDEVLYRDKISVSVGTRRYQERTVTGSPAHPPTVSTADLYRLNRFEDLPEEVGAAIDRLGGRILTTEFHNDRADRTVLVMKAMFEIDPGRENGGPKHWLFAFRESPDKRSAIEFRCEFSPSEAILGEKIFEDALRKMEEKEARPR